MARRSTWPSGPALSAETVNENTVELVFDRSLAGMHIGGTAVKVLSVSGSSISTSSWRAYVHRMPGDDRRLIVQHRTTDHANPALFRPGNVYVLQVSGIPGLRTADKANEFRIAGTDTKNAEPGAIHASAVNKRAVMITFSEQVKQVTKASFRVHDSKGKELEVSGVQMIGSGSIVTQATINLSADLADNEFYRVSFASGIVDAAGWNGLRLKNGNEPYTISFTGTSLENEAPRITRVRAIDRYTIEVQFSEPVQHADQAQVYTLRNDTDGKNIGIAKGTQADYRMSDDRKTLTLHLYPSAGIEPLRGGAAYTLTYRTNEAKIRDFQGKELEMPTDGGKLIFPGNDQQNAIPSITSVEAYSTFMLITLSEEIKGFNGQTNLIQVTIGGKSIQPTHAYLNDRVLTLRYAKVSPGSTGSVRFSGEGANRLTDWNGQRPATNTVNLTIR